MKTIYLALGNIAPLLAFEIMGDAEQYAENVELSYGFPAPHVIEVPVVPDAAALPLSGPSGFVPIDQASEVEL